VKRGRGGFFSFFHKFYGFRQAGAHYRSSIPSSAIADDLEQRIRAGGMSALPGYYPSFIPGERARMPFPGPGLFWKVLQ
jgi:hypothetical protein